MAKDAKGLISKRLTRAVMEFDLLTPGDKVLVALSGGKDSLALTYLLHRMSRSYPIPFQVEAVHVRSEVHPENLAPALKSLMEGWGVPFTILETSLKDFLKPGQELNCFICSRKRRETLLTYAGEKAFTAIALGHHMDDLLQTLLMNMNWKGELAAMPPKLEYRENLRMIRPLCLVQERHITKLVQEMEWKIPAKHCPYERESRRKEAAQMVETLTGGKDSLKYNLFCSLRNIRGELLPPPL